MIGWEDPSGISAKYRGFFRDCPKSDSTVAELIFGVWSQRYERRSILVTANRAFEEWTTIFRSDRLTGVLLDRLPHQGHILDISGDSYLLQHSRQNVASQVSDDPGYS